MCGKVRVCSRNMQLLRGRWTAHRGFCLGFGLACCFWFLADGNRLFLCESESDRDDEPNHPGGGYISRKMRLVLGILPQTSPQAMAQTSLPDVDHSKKCMSRSCAPMADAYAHRRAYIEAHSAPKGLDPF
jgi:hypothetical protein